ncbi:MAG: hypothetical protein ACKOA8_02040, partial [Deltaproteobacteria bacterium]
MVPLVYGKPVNTVLFDVFGTCVELTSSLEKQVSNWSQSQAVSLDELAFVSAWIEDHSIAVEEVRQGKLPWMTVDEIHIRG